MQKDKQSGRSSIESLEAMLKCRIGWADGIITPFALRGRKLCQRRSRRRLGRARTRRPSARA
jgi:hypothetical protein